MPGFGDIFGSASGALASVNSAVSLARSVPTVVSNVQGLVASSATNPVGSATGALSAAVGNVGSVRELNNVAIPGSSGPTQVSQSGSEDLRVRLSAQPAAITQVYGPQSTQNVLSILHSTKGLMFPYTPTIDWNQAVEYSQVSLTHANQDFFSYKNTPSTNINVSGEFTVQNQREAEYMIAVIHFLRVVSKMYFGKPRDNYPTGMPPPVLLFSGYGDFMFNDLPVIVRNHSFSLGKDVDYVDVKVAGGVVRLPTLLNLSLQLTVQQTPKKLRDEFNLDDFRTGQLMLKKRGWI